MLNIPKRVYPRSERESLKWGKKLSFVRRARVKLRLIAKGKQERGGKPSRAAKDKTSTKRNKFIKAGETALMIESGSFCAVEGAKASVSFFPPDEAVWAVASLPGGGRKRNSPGTARK